MTSVSEGIVLPQGVGQLPSWWLESVLHDTRDDVLRKKRRTYRNSVGLPQESIAEETQAIEMEKRRFDSVSAASGRKLTVENLEANDPSIHSTIAAIAVSEVTDECKETEADNSPERADKNKVSIKMTSDEEDLAVEAHRQKELAAEEYGQGKLRARPGNVKTVDSVLLNRDQYGNRQGQQARPSSDAASVPATSAPEDASTATASSSSTTGARDIPKGQAPKQYGTTFTGVSPFDFAMQQRAMEKERREKERISRENLSRHHGASGQADKAAENKASYDEERRKKKEAEDNIKMFKAADLSKKYEAATDLKKLQMEDKQKKKEAEEHLKGYRER
jgi:hypothetical protein